MSSREIDRKKFIELANKRVNRAIQTLRLIGNLSDKSNYIYKEEEVRQIFSTLQKEMNEARKRFEKKGVKKKESFQLSLF